MKDDFSINCSVPEMSDDDIFEAMKEIDGYIDITPSDFRELYSKAYLHAIHRYEHSIKAGDIMTVNVICVMEDTSLTEVAEIFAEQNISGTPVIKNDKTVTGIISVKDFLKKLINTESSNFMAVIAECLVHKGCIAESIRKGKAGDIMTSPVITCSESTPLFKISEMMSFHKINRMPVTDQNTRITGIITRTYIIKAWSERIKK